MGKINSLNKARFNAPSHCTTILHAFIKKSRVLAPRSVEEALASHHQI
jgi:hypothetical protein